MIRLNPSKAFGAMLVLALAMTVAAAAQQFNRFICLDGRFGDWRNAELLIHDPIDASDDAVVDFGTILGHADPYAIYLLIDLGREVNIQGMDGSVTMYFDVDGSEATGTDTGPLPGADLRVTCSRPRDGETRGSGVGAAWLGEDERDASIASIEFEAAPTFATSRFEIRLKRGTIDGAPLACFTGSRWSARFVATDADGNVIDTTDTFHHQLRQDARPFEPVLPDFDPHQRIRRAGARVVSWNVQYGAIVRDPQRYARLLKAMNPDVLLLQELQKDDDPRRLVRILNHACPTDHDRGWQVVKSSAGGHLRCAVASRWPLESLPDFETIPHSDDPDRTMRHCTAVVQIGNRRLLASSLHFQCCGSAGTREDRERALEAQQMHQALLRAYRASSADCAIVAGDLNLVGSVNPLHILIGQNNGPGTVLNVVDPRRLHGRSMSTWSDRHQPFPPGRLDYLMYGGAHFGVARSFVFDTADLPASWRTKHGLESDDSEAASDHRPIVADIFWQ